MRSLLRTFTAVLAFAGTFAGAWAVRSHLQTEASPPVVESASNQAEQQGRSAAFPITNTEGLEPNALAAPIRPKDVSVEEMLRLGLSLKEREQKILTEEQRLQSRIIQQQIAFNDMLKERDDVDLLRKRTSEQIQNAEQLITRLIQGRQAIIDERAATDSKLKEMEAARTEIDVQTQENTRRLSQWIQSMDSEKSAEVIREMANDGKMDVAVEILAYIEERDAAKILSSIDDAKLVQDLVQEFRSLKTSKDKKSQPSTHR